ncbi:MAG: VanZ family protein [Micrococcus sp.]|nr:VanZ family protein [Micrococcus sp.]
MVGRVVEAQRASLEAAVRGSSRVGRARPWLLVLFVAAVAAHLVVLYLPGGPATEPGAEIPGLDKLIHVIAFAVPTFLAVSLSGRRRAAVPFLLHAPLSEWVQHVAVPQRTGDVWDVSADVAGVVLGLWLARPRTSS